MRVLQLIDSLEAGGAERMAVNYANACFHAGLFSALATTRKEGPLLKNLLSEVGYLFLEKKYSADVSAILKLRNFCIQNKITHIHAHGSACFDAVLTKISMPRLKIVWHDHNGGRPDAGSTNLMLRICSAMFSHVIVVNQELENWARKNLFCDRVRYLPNFIVLEKNDSDVELLGARGSRILLLANLRKPKNHLLAVRVASIIHAKFPTWTFHFVGNFFNDDYENEVRALIKFNSLENVVFLYGRLDNIHQVIGESTIGIITSGYEGLPVSLLELGYHGKPVISTKVGDIPKIIKNRVSGLLAKPNDEQEFSKLVEEMINDSYLQKKCGEQLKDYVLKYHSEEAVINDYISFLN